jgi:hypothetical protein
MRQPDTQHQLVGRTEVGAVAPAADDERTDGGLEGLRTLVRKWTEDAAILREYGDERVARVGEMHAGQLAEMLQGIEWQTVSIEEAEEETGYTRGHLRRMLNEGKLPNAGTAKEPLILRCHLPRKPGYGIAVARQAGPYSRVQVARAIAEGE